MNSPSQQGGFDDGSFSLEFGSKSNVVSLREDCRLDRRCLRQVSELRIPGLGARTDRGALQEAPEPSCFRTTANVGVQHRLCSWEDEFSERQIVFSAYDDGGPLRRIRCRREHRPRQGARYRKSDWGTAVRSAVDASELGREEPVGMDGRGEWPAGRFARHAPGNPGNCLRRQIDPLHSRGSGKPILNATIAPGGVATRCPCCVAPKSRSQLPLWVIRVGPIGPTSSWHVRCASDSSRICALQRFDEECHNRTHAVQQKNKIASGAGLETCRYRWRAAQTTHVCALACVSCARPQIQCTAIGETVEPVAPRILSGAMINANSCTFLLKSSSSLRFSRRCTPFTTSAI